MANPELSQRIQELPEELLGLEREPGIAERLRRIDALKDRARALDPLDGVEDMALADYDRDWLVRYTYNSNAIEGSTLTLEDTSLVLEGEFVPSDSPARYVYLAGGRRSRGVLFCVPRLRGTGGTRVHRSGRGIASEAGRHSQQNGSAGQIRRHAAEEPRPARRGWQEHRDRSQRPCTPYGALIPGCPSGSLIQNHT